MMVHGAGLLCCLCPTTVGLGPGWFFPLGPPKRSWSFSGLVRESRLQFLEARDHHMMIGREPLDVICSSPHPKQGSLTLNPPPHSYTPYLHCPAAVGGVPKTGLWWAQGHAGSQAGIVVVLQ